MSIDIDIRCDECKTEVGNDEKMYCETCYRGLFDTICDLEAERDTLKKYNDELEEANTALHEQLADLGIKEESV